MVWPLQKFSKPPGKPGALPRLASNMLTLDQYTLCLEELIKDKSGCSLSCESERYRLRLVSQIHYLTKCEIWSQACILLPLDNGRTLWCYSDIWIQYVVTSCCHLLFFLDICVSFAIINVWSLDQKHDLYGQSDLWLLNTNQFILESGGKLCPFEEIPPWNSWDIMFMRRIDNPKT